MWSELVTVKRLGSIARLRWRLTTTLYLARGMAARQGVAVEAIIKGWKG